MKLLLDQNLSFRLINVIAITFPDSKHVKDFDLASAPDADVWGFAQKNGFTVVS